MSSKFSRRALTESWDQLQKLLPQLRHKAHPLAQRGMRILGNRPPTTTGTPKRRTSMARSTRGWSRSIMWSLVGLSGFSLVYGSVARIESSITVQGALEPIGGVLKVSAPLNSLVEQVLVKEGEVVKAGQPLVLLRNQAGNEQLQALLNTQRMLRRSLMLVNQSLNLPAEAGMPDADPRELAISRRETELREDSALSEVSQLRSALDQAMAEYQASQGRLSLNRSSHKRLEQLVDEGAISPFQMEREKEKLLDAELNFVRTSHRVDQAEEQLHQAQLRARHVTVADAKDLYQRRLNLQRDLASVKSQLAEQQQRMDLHTLKAPADGTVFDIAVGKGELASPIQPALQIVSRDTLQAKVFIPNKDVGFVKAGMPVEVRVDSYPFNEYGSITGKLLRVGASARKPEPGEPPMELYPATVVLDKSSLERNGKTHPLRSGMAITSLLKLGDRPAMALVSDKIADFFDSSKEIR